MAKLINGKNELQENVNAQNAREKKALKKGKPMLFILMLAIIVALVFKNTPAYILFGSVAIVSMVWFCCYMVISLRGTSDLCGLSGERRALELLSELDDNYTLFYSVNIPPTAEARAAQLDIVVVGPTGLFIVEVKNMNSHIVGRYDEREWTQHKVGCQGGKYERDFYSPVKQIKTHIYKLSEFLKSENAGCYINPLVYFSNNETTLDVDGGDVPVYGYENRHDMLNHVRSGKVLKTGQQKKIENALMKLL